MSQNGLVPDEAGSKHRAEHVTYHLVPAEVWTAQMYASSYEPEGFAQEGFIHCTDTLEELIAVGNRYYRADSRDFLVLAIDCEQVAANVVYEDERNIFPHIYGPLNTDAVLSMKPVLRGSNGTFLSMG